MVPITSFNALSAQISLHTGIALKIEWRAGDAAADTGLFLQVFDSTITPGTGTVPLKSYPIYGGSGSGQGAYDYKEFKRGDWVFYVGCFVGISSTESTYTAATTGNEYAMLSVELSDPEYPAGTSFAGSLTSGGVKSLQVWPESEGPKKLISIAAANEDSIENYIQIFSIDSPPEGSIPIRQFKLDGYELLLESDALQFGAEGIPITSTDSSNRERVGCTIVASKTSGFLTTITNPTCLMQAEYK